MENEKEQGEPLWFWVSDHRVDLSHEFVERFGGPASSGIDDFVAQFARHSRGRVIAMLASQATDEVDRDGVVWELVIGPEMPGSGFRPGHLVACDPCTPDLRWKKRFEEMAELAPIGMQLLNADGVPTYANSELLRIVGFGESGPKPDLASSLIHSDDLELVTGSFRSYVTSERDTWTERYRVIDEYGAVRMVESGVSRVTNKDRETEEFVSYTLELDEEPSQLRVLPWGDRRESETLAIGRVGHWSWTQWNDRLTFSDSMRDIYGFEPGLPLTIALVMKRIPSEQGAMIEREITRAMEETRSWEAEHDVQVPSNEVRRVISRGRCFQEERGLRLIGIAIDVTSQREREQQTRQAEKLRAIGQLASGVAHDFNNMLGAIMGNATVLSEEVPPELQRPVAEIQIAADRVTQLTRKLLTFSREQQIEQTPTDLHELLDEVFTLFKNSFPSGITITRRFGANSARIMGDSSQIQSAFLNIIVNARDALRRTGDSLEIVTSNFSEEETEWIEISFTDNGPGMTDDTRRRAFEPFFTTRRDEGGTGLGLSATYGAVIRHGGTIDLQTEEDLGTTFKLRFQTLGGPAEEGSVYDRSSKNDRGEGRTVWVVDDEPLMRSLAQRVFERVSYQVELFASGEDVLEALEHKTPDIFVIDHHMPRMSGMALIDALRKRGLDHHIVMVTGNAFDVDRVWAERAGVSSIVEKPYAVSDLINALPVGKPGPTD